jgi:gluconolactonase
MRSPNCGNDPPRTTILRGDQRVRGFSMNIRIPQALGSLVAAAALLGAARADTVLLSEAAYPEGPLWRDGKLLYVEYAGPGIKMWDGRRAVAYWSGEHCGASGLIAYRGDRILVACYDANTVVELDRTGKQIRAFDKDSAGRPFVGPNDFTADGVGGIYVTASGVYDLKAPISGTVLHLSESG